MEQARPPLLARVLGLAAVLVAAGVLVVWGVDLGQRVIGASKGEAGPSLARQLAAAEVELARVTAERDALADKLKAAPAAASSAAPPASTDAELAKLNADLALLEAVLPPARPGSGLSIRGMQARMASPRLLHYTVLLQYGARKKGPAAWSGRLKLAVTIEQGGKKSVLEYPKEGAERYAMTIENYQRVDGTLELPEGAKAVSVAVSMSENGKTVASEATDVR
ncbi:DUF6776 family protein [Pseudoduganella sp.]|uniref:DUF6776 family protein n=1 Tax=Pseudoduganella sp. TaxID=1880898 RepID=UPI0035B1C939